MPLPNPNLTWLQNGEPVLGTNDPSVGDGPMNRPTRELLDNDIYLDGQISGILSSMGQPNGIATLDSNGKIAHPSRVLDSWFGLGSTDSISFTSTPYSLPDPIAVLNIPPIGGSLVLQVSMTVAGSSNADSYAWIKPEISIDGGLTWQNASSADQPDAVKSGNNFAVHWNGLIYSSVASQVMVRIQFRSWNNSGDFSLCCYNWRQLSVIAYEL